MDAPDRSEAVRTIVDTFPQLQREDDGARRQMLDRIGTSLNRIDHGAWGRLQKPNEPATKADILVWKDTGEHFDVLTAAGGANWDPKGPIQPSWTWVAFEDVAPVEEPAPGDDDLIRVLENIADNIEHIGGHVQELRTDTLAAIEKLHADLIKAQADDRAAIIDAVTHLRNDALEQARNIGDAVAKILPQIVPFITPFLNRRG